jgi:pimeloyl-ACP methyl ester carboxylesterase
MRVHVKGGEAFVAAAGPAPATAAEVVVLLHGAGMASSIWAGQLTALATTERAVLAPTLPGHGRSGTSQGSTGTPPATIVESAAWVLALLDALGVPRVVVVGHSMGALIAMEVARAAPDRVRGVALLGAATAMRVHPALLEAARTAPARAAEQILEWGFGPPQAERPPALALVNVGRRLLNDSAAGVLAADLAACDAWQGGDFGAMRCPALVLVGSGDRMAPPKLGRALAEALPGAELRVVERVGHMLQVEAPRTVALALADWLGRLPPTA